MNRLISRVAVVVMFALVASTPAGAQTRSTIAQFLSPGFPQELVSAKKADRIAWIVYERGLRNIYTAAAPDIRPVRLTKFLDDDGTVLTDLSISDDGSTVVFVRGSEPNREGWIANPNNLALGAERAIWTAHTDGTGAWRLAEGGEPALSPNGRTVAFAKAGQIYSVHTSHHSGAKPSDHDADLIIKAWGKNGTISLYVADAASGEAREIWHNRAGDKGFTNIRGIDWADQSVVFAQEPDEWTRIYSVSTAGVTVNPVELTPGNGQVEMFNISADGKTAFYATNAGDIDRRHVWKVPTSGGTAVQITTGSEIETYPAPLASGKSVAVLTSSATRPMSVGIVTIAGGAKKLVYPSAIAAIGSWRSPVLVWQGDDDRNVQFSQTIGLVDLLRANNVPYELIVIPDDTHETLLHSRWLYTFGRMQDFLKRNLWNKNVATGAK